MSADLAGRFLRWTLLRAVLHRGWWLVTSLYLVLDANLTPFQLVFLGTAQGLVSLVCEVPTGVMADTISRKWSLVISHLLMGAGMLVTGLVTAFPALVATQMLWGVSWTFASGADVAWVTDELAQPERTARVLGARARWEQVGGASGMVLLGLLAWAAGRAPAIVLAGAAMLLLGLYVAARFPERNFVPTRTQRWRRSAAILRRGAGLARRDHAILLVFAATFLVNGAAEAFGRWLPRRLVDLDAAFQRNPIIWYTALGISTYALGALALRLVEARLDGAGGARRIYASACGVGAIGVLLLAAAPDVLRASAGALLMDGVAMPVTRAVGVIWVNSRATSEVRATVQSFLAQLEYFGEISCGVALGLLAQASSIAVSLACAAGLLALAGLLVLRSRVEGG